MSPQVNIFVIHWFNNYAPEFHPPTIFDMLDGDRVPSTIGRVNATSKDIYYVTNITYVIVGGDGKGKHPHHIIYNAIQCNIIQYIAIQYNAVRCS